MYILREEEKKKKSDMVKCQHLGNMGEGHLKILCTITITYLKQKLSKFKVKRKNNRLWEVWIENIL